MDSLPPPQDAAVTHGEAYGELTSLWWYANVLLRRRLLILALPVITGLFVGVQSLRSPRQYTASASFVPQEAIPAQVGLAQLASQFGLELFDAPLFGFQLRLRRRKLLTQSVLDDRVGDNFYFLYGSGWGRRLL